MTDCNNKNPDALDPLDVCATIDAESHVLFCCFFVFFLCRIFPGCPLIISGISAKAYGKIPSNYAFMSNNTVDNDLEVEGHYDVRQVFSHLEAPNVNK